MTEEEKGLTEEQESAQAEEQEQLEAAASEEEEQGEAKEEQEEEQPKRPKKSAQKRIAELTAKYRHTEREVQELRRLLSEQGRTQEAQSVQQPQKPKRDQFDDEDVYFEALADYRAEQKITEREQRQRQKSEQDRQQQQQQEFQKKVQSVNNTGIDTFDDYDEVVIENSDLQISDSMAQSIIEMDQGHLVAYHLGKNPQKAEQIAQKSAYRQTIELTKLEDQLSQKSKKKTTKTPPPVNPVSGQKETASKDPSKMTMDEWMDWRYGQLNKR